MAVTVALLVVILGVVITAVTLTYRASLQSDLRHRLSSAGAAVARSGSTATATDLAQGLALEGIATSIDKGQRPAPSGKAAAPAPVKTGTDISSRGGLLALTEVLPDGSRVTFSASQARISRSIDRLLVLQIAVGLAALALAAALVRRGTRSALRPLSEVVVTASAIASGDTSRRLGPQRTHTELGAMAAAFDQMVDALEEAVVGSRRSEETMARFLADAAHELRTPVAALQATAERLLRDQPARPERDELEASLAATASRLGRLIGDLLNLARLEGAEPAPSDPVNLEVVVRTAIAEVQAQGCGPEVTLDAGPATVAGDAAGLTRAVRNLIDNAVAAVGPGGHVLVRVGSRDTTLEVTVTDDGPGILPADRERIFHRFVRSASPSAPGTGLGLAIARGIARQHGGEVTCDDVPKGASFTLQLPARPSS